MEGRLDEASEILGRRMKEAEDIVSEVDLLFGQDVTVLLLSSIHVSKEVMRRAREVALSDTERMKGLVSLEPDDHALSGGCKEEVDRLAYLMKELTDLYMSADRMLGVPWEHQARLRVEKKGHWYDDRL